MASEIPAAKARRILQAILALEEATIFRDVPFGDHPDMAGQPLPVQILDAHAAALNLLREALSAFEAAVGALEQSQAQDQARSRALQTRTDRLLKLSSALLTRVEGQA